VTAIRVLLADDHPVVREGLRGMLTTYDSDSDILRSAGYRDHRGHLP
jgi:DNA-binding NarL/FixJ family response regulator